MKKIVLVLSIFLSLILSSLLVIGCQDEDFGYTKEDIFRGAYERNFVKAFGAIDPNETWDFSYFGGRHKSKSTTRAEEGWYDVNQRLIDDYFENTLKEGVDHSASGTNFCLLTGHENFTLTPVYKSSNSNNWELHMVMFTPDRTEPYDVVVWNNAMSDVLKIQTSKCPTCDGHGFFNTIPDGINGSTLESKDCQSCDNGWVISATCTHGHDSDRTNCDDCKPCPTCRGLGETETGECATCTGNGSLPCTKCNGNGYYSTKANGNGKKSFYGCSDCGGSGSVIFTGKQKDLRTAIANNTDNIQSKIGKGSKSCSVCGGDGLVNKVCDTCLGDKYFIKCVICNGTNHVYICPSCNGTGSSNGEWHSITLKGDPYNTQDAVSIEGKSRTAEEVLGVSIPTDGVIYFYLTTDGVTKNSMENGMRLFTPDFLNTPNQAVKMIACESGDRDNDYNDFIFLISGSPKALRTEMGNSFTSVVSKRYMCEDFGSNADWDFNDIVIDVTRSLTQNLQKQIDNKTKKESIVKKETDRTIFATIKWLGGTLPLQLSIGTGVNTATTNKITNPTNQGTTWDELEPDGNSTTGSEDGNPGWEVNFTFNTPSWDPDANNIKVTVWKDWGNSVTNKESNIWQSQFPAPGDVPYIIATDQTDAWSGEGTNVSGMDWFKLKYDNQIIQ